MASAPRPLVLPQIAQPEHWTDLQDATRLCGWTTRWLAKQVSSGHVQSREVGERLPNGRFAREYLVSSLPVEARQRFQAEQAQLVKAEPAQATLPLFGRPQLVTEAPRVRVVKAHETAVAAKHRILEPILAMQHEHHRRAYAASLRLADGRPVCSQNRMIEFQIEQSRERGEELNARTVKRWVAAHKAEGIAGLARRQRKDSGRSRFFDRAENQNAAAAMAYLYLGNGILPGLSVQACYEVLRYEREAVGLPEDALPHYDTVRTFLGRITPALKVFALKGRKEFAERMLPYLSRAYDEPSNAIWVSDTMIADVEVMNDCIEGAAKGAPIRLRLTAIIDFRSRFVIGYSWAWEGSSASITSAIRHAIEQHGPCQLWYCDNGKDYCKVARGATPGYMRPSPAEPAGWVDNEVRAIEGTGVLGRLGIAVTHCLAHHPQSKHVERFFRTLHMTFCKLWPTYTGGKPSERPDQTTALMEVHRRAMRRGDLTASHHPLASEFIRAFDAWLPIYHAKRHGGRGMSHRSPAEVFAAERNPNQRPAPAFEDLVWLLAEHTTRKVRECQVTVNGVDYAPTDALQSRLMLDRTERSVAIAYDPLDASRVAVLDDAGRLVTILAAKRLVRMAPDDPETQAQIAAMQQQRGTLVRELREDRLALTRAGKQLGVLHPLELLTASAGTTPIAELPATRITARKVRAVESTSSAPLYAHDVAARIRGMKASK